MEGNPLKAVPKVCKSIPSPKDLCTQIQKILAFWKQYKFGTVSALIELDDFLTSNDFIANFVKKYV